MWLLVVVRGCGWSLFTWITGCVRCLPPLPGIRLSRRRALRACFVWWSSFFFLHSALLFLCFAFLRRFSQKTRDAPDGHRRAKLRSSRQHPHDDEVRHHEVAPTNQPRPFDTWLIHESNSTRGSGSLCAKPGMSRFGMAGFYPKTSEPAIFISTRRRRLSSIRSSN